MTPAVPPPPDEPQALLAWADSHGVLDRLDDQLFASEGPPERYMTGRFREVATYREILVGAVPLKNQWGQPMSDARPLAREYLHRMATLTARHRERRDWLDANGRPPTNEILIAFLERLEAALQALPAEHADVLPVGTYQVDRVRVTATPVPLLRYAESTLMGFRHAGRPPREAALLLLGWQQRLGWAQFQDDDQVADDVPGDLQHRALGAMIDLLRDTGAVAAHELLASQLRLPAWQFVLGRLDHDLVHLQAAGAATTRPADERLAFRVEPLGEGGFNIEPVIQKRARNGGYSKGSRFYWHNLTNRPGLTEADERVYQAYSHRRLRDGTPWAGWLTPGQVFHILRALIDHPAVFLGGAREGSARLDIRQGRLRLQFATGTDGGLSPSFDLLGVHLLAAEVATALRDGRHLVHLHRPAGASPQVLLAELSPEGAALVSALAAAPTAFPPEAHDALAQRLESLQEVVDIEFPSHWTRTIGPAPSRPVARLELLASGALKLRLAVRPVAHGAVFAPGEGPALMLEGRGRDRHGARRDLQQERRAAHALGERLGLAAAEELEPWHWRVPEGDPALDLVATLGQLSDEVEVEWVDDARLLNLGSVGRRDMRLQVADRRDWFGIEGGAEVDGQVVPLALLLTAIRDERRYVRVGRHGFVRIEETLRRALASAEGTLFEYRGTLQLPRVGSDPLIGLVEAQAQIEASQAFAALRRRIQEGAAAQPRLPAALEAALRPYQKAGVTWMARLAHWEAGAILADEMGLGKTIQTLALLQHRSASGPALVVAPTSVVMNWVNEAARFAPGLNVRLYRGPDRGALLAGLGAGDLLVTSYTIATQDHEALKGIRFGSLVLDEAQAVKNATTERARALRDLQAGWRLGLTGTPIENHLGELWSLLRVISPGLLGSWEQFRARFAIPIEKFGDEARRRSLAALLRPFILRRTKAEVAPELPPRTEIIRLVQLSPEEQSLYEQLRQSTVNELEEAKRDPDRDASNFRFTMLAALTRLRQLCCHPRLVHPGSSAGSAKAAHLLELLAELREGGHRVLVFSQFRSFLELLLPRLLQEGLRVLVLDGTTPAELRDRRIAQFQRGDADVFLISLKAGGFGLNLTAADTVIHLDPWWNPAVEDQATARAHRMGQQRPVTAVRLVARGTVEEGVLELHASKRALAEGVLEGSDAAAQLGTDELAELIRAGGGAARSRKECLPRRRPDERAPG